MSLSRKSVLVTSSALAACALSWVLWQSSTDHAISVQDSSTAPAREPGGSSRLNRLAAAAQAGTDAGAPVDETNLNISEMRRVVKVPMDIGKTGLWAGVSPSDAAIGGRVAYAVARAGDSRADLRPDSNGMFQRMHAPINQRIELLVRYPGLKPGEWVDVGLLDGGTLDTPGPFQPDAEGRVSFIFHTGPSDGSYRISLTTSDHDTKMLDIWAGRPEWEGRLTAN